MAKMPEYLTLYIENKLIKRGKTLKDPVEYDKDIKKAMEKGDEVGIHAGIKRQRTTYYKVISVYANSVHLRRSDSIEREVSDEKE